VDVPALVSYAVEATRPGGTGRTPFNLTSTSSTEREQQAS